MTPGRSLKVGAMNNVNLENFLHPAKLPMTQGGANEVMSKIKISSRKRYLTFHEIDSI